MDRMKAFSQAAYLGKELARAELSMVRYVQDGA
jgi:hypothetical protein